MNTVSIHPDHIWLEGDPKMLNDVMRFGDSLDELMGRQYGPRPDALLMNVHNPDHMPIMIDYIRNKWSDNCEIIYEQH